MKIVKKWKNLSDEHVYYDDDYDEWACYGISEPIWRDLEGKEVLPKYPGVYIVYWKPDILPVKEHFLTVLEEHVEEKNEQSDNDVE